MSPLAEAYAEMASKRSKEVRSNARTELDISYGPDRYHFLDLYLPKDASPSPVPVLIFIHGGAWTHGYKEWMGFMAPAINMLPAIFVSVDYRLGPETTFPGPVEDCRRALKWVYDNIGRYGGNPDAIFTGGHSAGAHLASLISVQRDALAAYGLAKDVVKGCFPVSGTYDFTGRDRPNGLLNSPDEAPVASPVNYLAGNRTPFFISYGENDYADLITQAPIMADALKAVGSPVKLMEFEGCDHFDISLENGKVNGVWAETVRQWMSNPPA